MKIRKGGGFLDHPSPVEEEGIVSEKYLSFRVWDQKTLDENEVRSKSELRAREKGANQLVEQQICYGIKGADRQRGLPGNATEKEGGERNSTVQT